MSKLFLFIFSLILFSIIASCSSNRLVLIKNTDTKSTNGIAKSIFTERNTTDSLNEVFVDQMNQQPTIKEELKSISSSVTIKVKDSKVYQHVHNKIPIQIKEHHPNDRKESVISSSNESGYYDYRFITYLICAILFIGASLVILLLGEEWWLLAAIFFLCGVASGLACLFTLLFN